jgi:beta-lactam-binding protein with PASTA domain
MKINKKLLGIVAFHLSLMLVLFSGFVWVFFEWVLPTVTKHGQAITVPSLRGIHVDELDSYLTPRHLQFAVTDDVAYSPVYPPSVVLEQYPKAGTRVKEGRRIYLTLNAIQPPEVCMPNLADGSLRNAQVMLKSIGLSYGEIKYVPDIAQNAVLGQYYKGSPIAPGTRIPHGSRIDLVVGAGLAKQLVPMPDLVGMSLEHAELLLLDTGIRLGNIVYLEKDASQESIVVQQLPKPGVQVRFGETVDLWLSKPIPELFKATSEPKLDNNEAESEVG